MINNRSSADNSRHLIFCIGVLLLCSLFIKITKYRLDPFISRDGIFYVTTIVDWETTGNVPDYAIGRSWLPLYPFLVKCLSEMGPSIELSGICINMLFGTLLALVFYGIAFETTQSKTLSFCAALLASFHPTINTLSTEIQRDVVYLFFSGCVIWCFLAGINRKKSAFFFAAGFFSACAVLTRFEAIEFLVIVFPIIFCIAAKFISFRKSFEFCFSFFLSFLIFLVVLSECMGTSGFLRKQYVQYAENKITSFPGTSGENM